MRIGCARTLNWFDVTSYISATSRIVFSWRLHQLRLFSEEEEIIIIIIYIIIIINSSLLSVQAYDYIFILLLFSVIHYSSSFT